MPRLIPLPDLDRQSYKPLYLQLTELLAHYIRENHLPSGSPLPSEKDLVERFLISRMTVRLAFDRLRTQGLIYKIQGKGAFVADTTSKGQIRAFETIEKILEQQGFTATNVLLDFTFDYPPVWAGGLNLAQEAKVQILRRIKMIQGKSFAVESRAFPVNISRLFQKEELCEKPIFDLLRSRQETHIYGVKYRLSACLVSKAAAKELRVKQNSPALVRDGLYYNRKEEPIMASRLMALVDVVELHFDFRQSADGWLVAAGGQATDGFVVSKGEPKNNKPSEC